MNRLKTSLKFVLGLAGSLPLCFLWHVYSTVIATIILPRDRLLRPWSERLWVAFVLLQVLVWSLPIMVAAIRLRKKLGWAFFWGVVCALLFMGWWDGGHLLRRAFVGKF